MHLHTLIDSQVALWLAVNIRIYRLTLLFVLIPFFADGLGVFLTIISSILELCPHSWLFWGLQYAHRGSSGKFPNFEPFIGAYCFTYCVACVGSILLQLDLNTGYPLKVGNSWHPLVLGSSWLAGGSWYSLSLRLVGGSWHSLNLTLKLNLRRLGRTPGTP